MKRITRKGFTGIELVIVIAIIAILAAALIPTFSGLFDSANKTADLQAAREMDMAIKLAAAGEDLTIQEVIVILDEAGFDVTSLKPLYKHNAFYWNEEKDYIVLWDKKANEVVYPEGGEMPLLGTDQGDLLHKGSGYFVTDIANEESFRTAMENGTSVKLTEDVMVSAPINTPADKKITIDLGDKKLSTDYTDSNKNKHAYALNVYGEVTITNGTIDARGVQVMNGGKLILGEGVTINAIDSNGGACVWVYAGGKVEISGGTYTAMNKGVYSLSDPANPGVINNSGEVVITGGTFVSADTCCYLIINSGELEISFGTFSGTHGILANSGTATITAGDFTLRTHNDSFDGYNIYASAGEVTISGGTFTGGNFTFYDSEDSTEVDGVITVSGAVNASSKYETWDNGVKQ